MSFPWDEGFAWEDDDDPNHEFDDSDLDHLSPERASLELMDFLVDLRNRGSLSARHVCVIAWLAKRAGAKGAIEAIGKKPGGQSGHYSRHLDTACGLKPHESDDLLYLQIPQYQRLDGSRSVRPVATLTPHEEIAEEVNSTPGLPAMLAAARAAKSVPPSYEENPIARSNPGVDVYPLALYVDGIKFEPHDAVVGFFLYNMLTGRRHCVAGLRKSAACRCGCRGWCSYFHVFAMIRWSCEAMAAGRFPCRRPFDAPFTPKDAVRQSFAGRDLGFKAALVLVKGDLSEFANTFGVPTWASKFQPCFLCTATKQQLFELSGFSPIGTPFPLKTAEMYHADCDRCEVKVTLRTEAERARLRANLFLDNRQHGSHGRALKCDLPELSLLKGDRIEPSAEVPDTHAFEDLPLPIVLTVWRPSLQGMTYHRNPIFSQTLHVSLHDSVSIDWLHTLSLGIFQDFVGTLIQALIDQNAWQIPASTADERRRLSISRLQAGLFKFYADQARRGILFTAVQRLDEGMFGTRDQPKCKLHGAETNGVLAYCAVLIKNFRAVLNAADIWERVCKSLLRMKELCDMDAAMFNAAHVQEPRLHQCRFPSC
jgi:hypothetical protein